MIVITGPSGSGKSTIIQPLRDRADLRFSISATTRDPRPGERHGVDYLFVTPSQFQAMIDAGELVEWAEFNDHLYGTPAGPLKKAIGEGNDVLLDIEIQGARQIREKFPDATMIFIAPPSMEELERRLRARKDTSEGDIEERLDLAAELDATSELFDHVVVNRVAEDAIKEVVDLIRR